MAKPETFTMVVRGEAGYAKVLGPPTFGYKDKYKQWSMDIILDAAGVKDMEANGLGNKVKKKKNKKDGSPLHDHRPFISVASKVRDENEPEDDRIVVEDSFGNAWPQKTLIGNGSMVDVRIFVIPDEEDPNYTGMYPKTIRVLKHEEYEGAGFAPLDKDDPFFKDALAAAETVEQEMTDAQEPSDPPFETEEEIDPLDDEIPID